MLRETLFPALLATSVACGTDAEQCVRKANEGGLDKATSVEIIDAYGDCIDTHTVGEQVEIVCMTNTKDGPEFLSLTSDSGDYQTWCGDIRDRSVVACTLATCEAALEVSINTGYSDVDVAPSVIETGS